MPGSAEHPDCYGGACPLGHRGGQTALRHLTRTTSRSSGGRRRSVHAVLGISRLAHAERRIPGRLPLGQATVEFSTAPAMLIPRVGGQRIPAKR